VTLGFPERGEKQYTLTDEMGTRLLITPSARWSFGTVGIRLVVDAITDPMTDYLSDNTRNICDDRHTR